MTLVLTPFIKLSETVYIRMDKNSDLDICNPDNWIACISGDQLFVKIKDILSLYTVEGTFEMKKYAFSIIAAELQWDLLEKYSVSYKISSLDYKGDPRSPDQEFGWWSISKEDILDNFSDQINTQNYYIEDDVLSIEDAYTLDFETSNLNSENVYF